MAEYIKWVNKIAPVLYFKIFSDGLERLPLRVEETWVNHAYITRWKLLTDNQLNQYR